MEPKYSLGQEVYFIKNDEVQNLPIVGVFRGLDEEGNFIKYGFDLGNGNYGMYDIEDLNYHDWIFEDNVFLTKEDLIKSL